MKYLKQFGIISAVTCAGEMLKYFIPFPIPASIYGLVIMFLLLLTGFLKLEQVKETGDFLIEIMPLMFIPTIVGLIVSWEQLKTMLVPFVIITVVSILVVIFVTGKVTDLIVYKKGDDTDE